MRSRCSWTPCIQPMLREPWAAGRRRNRSSRSSRRAGAIASTFTARSIWRAAKPMIEAESIDAKSTIRLLEALEALYPLMVCIHVFLDNASYHHAKLVKQWLSRPGRRIKLHFLPAFCPHLNPIERLWGVMHKNITHNKCYETCGEFARATLVFLRSPEGGPKYAILSPKISV